MKYITEGFIDNIKTERDAALVIGYALQQNLSSALKPAACVISLCKLSHGKLIV